MNLQEATMKKLQESNIKDWLYDLQNEDRDELRKEKQNNTPPNIPEEDAKKIAEITKSNVNIGTYFNKEVYEVLVKEGSTVELEDILVLDLDYKNLGSNSDVLLTRYKIIDNRKYYACIRKSEAEDYKLSVIFFER